MHHINTRICNAPLKGCLTEHFVGQGFSPASYAPLKGCPTKDWECLAIKLHEAEDFIDLYRLSLALHLDWLPCLDLDSTLDFIVRSFVDQDLALA